MDGWVKDNRLYLRVVDYKSGKKAFDLAAVRMGLDIQMLLYLFALKKEGKQRFGMDIEPAGVLYLPARDEILSAERNITPEQLQSQREKELRRTGLLLSEPEVLQAMEHEALQSPRFLPVRVNSGGGRVRRPWPPPISLGGWGSMWSGCSTRSPGRSGTATSTRTPAATMRTTASANTATGPTPATSRMGGTATTCTTSCR